MDKYDKIFIILGIIILVLLVLNIYRFFSKNKVFVFKRKNSKKIYDAIVIDKRHYTENNRDLFYVKFSYDEKEEEFLVTKYLFNIVSINQIGKLIIQYECFYDFII